MLQGVLLIVKSRQNCEAVRVSPQLELQVCSTSACPVEISVNCAH